MRRRRKAVTSCLIPLQVIVKHSVQEKKRKKDILLRKEEKDSIESKEKKENVCADGRTSSRTSDKCQAGKSLKGMCGNSFYR
jgi:hypothetical protein